MTSMKISESSTRFVSTVIERFMVKWLSRSRCLDVPVPPRGPTLVPDQMRFGLNWGEA